MEWKEAMNFWIKDCRWELHFNADSESKRGINCERIQAFRQKKPTIPYPDIHTLIIASCSTNNFNNVPVMDGASLLEKHKKSVTSSHFHCVCRCRLNIINMKSCRMWEIISSTVSPTSTASCCHILAWRWLLTQNLTAGLEVRTRQQ